MIIEVNLGYHSKKLYPLINDQYTIRLDEAFRYSEMIWKIWKISVLVIITPKETSSAAAAALLPLYMYIHCFSELRRMILK